MSNLALQLADNQQTVGTFAVLDAKGNPDPSSDIAWAIDDATVATVQPSDGTGHSITLVAQKPGVTVLHGTSGGLPSFDVSVTVLSSADTSIAGSFAPPTAQ